MAKEICKEDGNELEFRSQNSFQFDAFIAFAYEDTEYVLLMLYKNPGIQY